MTYLVTMLLMVAYTHMESQGTASNLNAWWGTYMVVQVCDGATNPSYAMEVQRAPSDSSTLYLKNVGNYGQKVEATVQGDSITLIPTQVHVGLMGDVRLSGSGTLRPPGLVMQLSVEVPGPQGTTTTSACELRGTPVKQ